MHSIRALISALVSSSLAMVLWGCSGGPLLPGTSTPERVAVNVPFDDFRLDLPDGPSITGVTRRTEFFGGAATTSMAFNLQVSGVVAGTSLTLFDGANVARTVPLSNGALSSPAVMGNVAALVVSIPPRTSPPVIAVRSVSMERVSAPFFPVVEPLAPRVTAYPLTPGQPVDLAFTRERSSAGAPVETFFFSVTGLGNGPFDVVAFGGASVRIADPAVGFPVISSSTVIERLSATRTANILPAAEIVRLPGGRQSIVLAVSNDGIVQPNGFRDGRHVRIVVLPVGSTVSLGFPSSQGGAFFPLPIGMDTDGTFLNDRARIGSCTNFQGISPEVRVAAGGVPLTTPRGNITLPAFDVGGPLPPVCYDGHPGTDFMLTGSFLAQAVGVPVIAAAPGVVVSVKQGLADTCFANPLAGFAITCPDQSPVTDANSVVVLHADGEFGMYLHLRRGSVRVRPGDRIFCGQHIADVGSSGDSSSSHVHFELRAPGSSIGPDTDLSWQNVRNMGRAVDPYGARRWTTVTGNLLPAPCIF